MSWSERSVRYHKHQTDHAIRGAYAQLATDIAAVAAFHELLYWARKRAPRLLDAPVVTGQHLGVEALVNLSRFRGTHIRRATDWTGTISSWRPAVSSLAHHLVCKYEVPLFLASSWYATEDVDGDKKRFWFVAHASGVSFRSLDLPIAMTRKMERVFIGSHDHLGIDCAIRRAELIALGAPAEFVQAVLSSRVGTDLTNGMFWRTVWHFLIANAGDVDPAQIGPMIDFIQAIRHDRVAMETPDGTVELEPPQPAFSMKGRSMRSMLRLMDEWHRSLGLGSSGLTWTPSSLKPMLIEESSQDVSVPPRRWQIIELTNSAQLQTEGSALRHCVASYAERCSRGTSRIWSLRFRRGEKNHHVLTIEVDPKRRAIVQARGSANRAPSGKPLQLLQDWAVRERLQMAI
jgi:hypothetical protein